MKKIPTILFVMAILVINVKPTKAQDTLPKKIKEYGLGFSNLNAYSLQYHWGNELFYKTASLNFGLGGSYNPSSGTYTSSNNFINSSGNSIDQSPYNLNLGFGFGIVHLKKVNNNFGFNYGWQFGFSSQVSKAINTSTNKSFGTVTVTDNTITNEYYRPNLGYTLGVYYKFSNQVFMYAAISPALYYSYNVRKDLRKETTTGNNQDPQTANYKNTNYNNAYGISFSNGGAFITLAYRITYDKR